MKRQVLAAVAAIGALSLSACGSGVTANGGDGDTYTLTGVTAAPAGSPSEAITEWFVEEVEKRSDGRLVVDMAATGTQCDAAEVVVCVQDGRADLGVSVPDYTPQLFPDAAVVGLPFLGLDHGAVTEALAKTHEEHEGAQQLYEDHGLTYISEWPVGRLLFGTKQALESADGLEGQKMRLSNPLIMRAGEIAGANNVSLTAAETYESIERGVADGVGFSLDGAVSFNLAELLPYWSDPGTGHYSSFAMWINSDTYQGLPEDLQAVVEEVKTELNTGQGAELADTKTAEQCDQLNESSNLESLEVWEAGATEAWKDELGTELEERWLQEAEEYGLNDPQGYLETYKKNLEAAGNNPEDDPTVQCLNRSN